MTFRPDMSLADARVEWVRSNAAECPCCSRPRDLFFPPPANEAERVTQEAIERVDRGTDPQWRERALQALYALSLTREMFTPDDLWELVELPREPRCSGPLMLRGKRNGWFEFTGTLRPSVRPSRHQNHIKVYRSLIFNP